MILGDSLSASYGMSVESGWVSLLAKRLTDKGYDEFEIINASVSGEITKGARARLTKLLENNKPTIVVIELGGNDGLRGFSLEEIKNNLKAIINKIKHTGAKVLLVPMQLPPNYGLIYNSRFMKIYKEISKETKVVLSKFILEGIAQNSELMQADMIHPKAKAQSKMLDNIWSGLEEIISNK